MIFELIAYWKTSTYLIQWNAAESETCCGFWIEEMMPMKEIYFMYFPKEFPQPKTYVRLRIHEKFSGSNSSAGIFLTEGER